MRQRDMHIFANRMIEQGDEQLNEDNPDREKLEAVGTMMAKRVMSSKESERKKRDLITIGKAKGFLTYDEVNDHMPESIGSSDQIDDWLSALGGEGIELVDSASHVKGTDRTAPGELALSKRPTQNPHGRPRWRKRKRTATPRPTIRCVCTCARWARYRC